MRPALILAVIAVAALRSYAANDGRVVLSREIVPFEADELEAPVWDTDRRFHAPMLLMSSVDPLAGGTSHLSPYVFCAANPIQYIDLTGCVFTKPAERLIKPFEEEIERRINDANTSIIKALKNISSASISDRERNKAIATIEKAKDTIKEMSEIKAEIAELRNSSQYYHIIVDTSNKVNLQNPYQLYDRDLISVGPSGEVSMVIHKKGKRGFGSLAHELKHAYQFENGLLSLNGERDGTPLYDLHDEIEAFDRGMMFGQRRDTNIRKVYKGLQEGPIDVTNSSLLQNLDEEGLQNYAIKHGVMFRYSGVTYVGLKSLQK